MGHILRIGNNIFLNASRVAFYSPSYMCHPEPKPVAGWDHDLP